MRAETQKGRLLAGVYKSNEQQDSAVHQDRQDDNRPAAHEVKRDKRSAGDAILLTENTEYNEAVNKIDSRRWTAKDIVTYLQDKSNEISFSDYARKYIDRMIDRGQQRNARNYNLALSNLELFFRSNQINFSQLTSNVVNRWIATLAQTHRARRCILYAYGRYSGRPSMR